MTAYSLLETPIGTLALSASAAGLSRVRFGAPPAGAVGRANALNPLVIVVPCHRVIGTSGKLTGYTGGMHRKEALLRLEGIAL